MKSLLLLFLWVCLCIAQSSAEEEALTVSLSEVTVVSEEAVVSESLFSEKEMDSMNKLQKLRSRRLQRANPTTFPIPTNRNLFPEGSNPGTIPPKKSTPTKCPTEPAKKDKAPTKHPKGAAKSHHGPKATTKKPSPGGGGHPLFPEGGHNKTTTAAPAHGSAGKHTTKKPTPTTKKPSHPLPPTPFHHPTTNKPSSPVTHPAPTPSGRHLFP